MLELDELRSEAELAAAVQDVLLHDGLAVVVFAQVEMGAVASGEFGNAHGPELRLVSAFVQHDGAIALEDASDPVYCLRRLAGPNLGQPLVEAARVLHHVIVHNGALVDLGAFSELVL